MYVPRSQLESLLPRKGRKMLFVHVPKCGGKYVETAFGRAAKRCISIRHPNLRGHLYWTEYRDRMTKIGKNIGDYYCFCQVRNPYAWRVSFYTFIKDDSGGRISGLPHLNILFNKMSFSDYVEWLLDPATPTTQRFRPKAQISDWCTNEEGQIAVDYILRQESLQGDLAKMADTFGLWINIPQKPINTSNSSHWLEYYSDSDLERIAKLHTRDFELFGYQIDPGKTGY